MIDLYCADALDVLRQLPDNSVDSLITDPPAGIGFMGKSWDAHESRVHFIAELSPIFREVLRVLKPGAHGFVWALPRTSHWTASALEDAGFEVRDVITHLFGSGFPKSLDVSKAIDAAAGAEREVIGTRDVTKDYEAANAAARSVGNAGGYGGGASTARQIDVTANATDEAKQWAGWGTALKPASEHWLLVRKPLAESTVAANVLAYGTGALNIDVSRIGTEQTTTLRAGHSGDNGIYGSDSRKFERLNPPGRWPANVVLSHNDDCDDQCTADCAVAALDAQSGVSQSVASLRKAAGSVNGNWAGTIERPLVDVYGGFNDKGTASRFFYIAKSSTSEKNAGLTKCKCGDKEWESADLKVNIQVASDIQPLRDTIESHMTDDCEWPMTLNGNEQTGDESLTDTRFTTEITTSKTTIPPTSNFSIQQPTSDCMAGANSLTEYGGSLVESAANDCQSMQNTSTFAAGGPQVNASDARSVQRSQPNKSGSSKCPSCGGTKGGHPTVKPVQLMRYLITMITPPGGLVIDPFLGSGTTAVACKEAGFDCIGIDNVAEYIDIAHARVEHIPVPVVARARRVANACLYCGQEVVGPFRSHVSCEAENNG